MKPLRQRCLLSSVALLTIVLGTVVGSASAVQPERHDPPRPPCASTGRSGCVPSARVSDAFGLAVERAALRYMHTPYCWDGGTVNGPSHGTGDYSGQVQEATDCGNLSVKGFDCTGLALYAIHQAGGPNLFDVAHSDAIVNYGTRVAPSAMQPGDILVFGTGPGLHVGIYMGRVNGIPYMVDANTSYPGRPNGVYDEPVAWEEHDPSFHLTAVLRFGPTTPTTPTKQNAADHVLRVSATGTAYLVDASGVPHWIPDGLTYECDVAQYPLWDGVTQAEVNALGNGQPWATRCDSATVAENHVLVVGATNTSYYVDGSGVLHWIPSLSVFTCISGSGVPVLRGLVQSQVDAMGSGQPWATCADAQPPSSTGNAGGGTVASQPQPTPRSISIAWSSSHANWISMTLQGFPSGLTSYTCDFASGGDQSFPIVLSGSPETVDNGHTCFDSIAGDQVWVSIGSVTSNRITVGSGAVSSPPVQPPSGGTTTYSETAGGVAHTWSDYSNAGGTQGASVSRGQTIQVACRAQGLPVADGNVWWYQIASAPWNGTFWVSADAFYNDGATSGSLAGTPFFDPSVPVC